jgi:hypothetical protein
LSGVGRWFLAGVGNANRAGLGARFRRFLELAFDLTWLCATGNLRVYGACNGK